MLKIKDELDLKELEKFGFEKQENGQYQKIYTTICKNRNIQGKGGTPAHSKTHLAEEIYDLITAGLVEKIEERREELEQENNSI